MPRKYLMSWEAHPQYRWIKMYKGKRYRVSCERKLKRPRTKEESYLAANDWWERQLAKLSNRLLEPEQVEQLRLLQLKIDYASNSAPDLLPRLQQTRREILDTRTEILPDQQTIDDNLAIARKMGIVVPPDIDPDTLQLLFGDKMMMAGTAKQPSLYRPQLTRQSATS